MDRGVIIGGALICASFLVALALNRSEVEPKSPAKSYEPAPEVSIGAAPDLHPRCTKAVPDPSSEPSEHALMTCE